MKLEHPIIFSVSRRREQAFIVFKGMIFVKSQLGFTELGYLMQWSVIWGKVQATFWLRSPRESHPLPDLLWITLKRQSNFVHTIYPNFAPEDFLESF